MRAYNVDEIYYWLLIVYLKLKVVAQLTLVHLENIYLVSNMMAKIQKNCSETLSKILKLKKDL